MAPWRLVPPAHGTGGNGRHTTLRRSRPRLVPPADDPRIMLQSVLEAEKQAIADYNQRIEQAEAFGDIGLKVDLENHVADETRHKEEIERILAGWDQR